MNIRTDIASHVERINALRAQQPKLVHRDQSANVRCPIHGHHCFAYFIANGVPPQYVCGHCWGDITEARVASIDPVGESEPFEQMERLASRLCEVDF